MKIAVDAMGGDFGPRISVAGAVQAARELGLEILLVGAESAVRGEIDRLGAPPAGLTIVDAPESIGMGDGVLALRRKRHSSIRIGAQLVRDGQADGFVSMGNTSAVVFISRKVLGPLPGVYKPALALLLPSTAGSTLLLDVGANANCQPQDLLQFAAMGKVFMERVIGVANPRVALMSIGEEESKGNDLTRAAHDLIAAGGFRFVGNVEGKDLYAGKAEVIVSDGFTGNVALKVSEGVVEHLASLAKREITKDLLAKIGLLLMKRNLKRLYRNVDYAEFGGAQLLGLNGVCIVGHGRSNAKAVKNAIGRAKEFVVHRVQDRIRDELARLAPAAGGA